MRKSTKPPANACGGKMLSPIGNLNCSGDAVGPAEYLLSPFQTPSTVIAAVTGELLTELRRAASRNEIGVIEAPLRRRKTSRCLCQASHLNDARKRIEHES